MHELCSPFLYWGNIALGFQWCVAWRTWGFDIMGIFIVAMISSTDGGLLCDGLLLKDGPPLLLRTPVYLEHIVVTTVLSVIFGKYCRNKSRFPIIVSIIDAIGIGAYAVLVMNLAERAGLPTLSVIVVGMANAVGGSILCDLLLGETPQLLKPGAMLGITSFLGCVLFIFFGAFGAETNVAGNATVFFVFVFRMVAMRFNLK